MSLLLAATGGLLSGVGQGIDADVQQMIKDRATELANDQQMKVIGVQQQGAKDLQSNQQTFQADQSDKNHQWDQTYQAQAQANQDKLQAAQITAQHTEGEANRANAVKLANLGPDDQFQTADGKLWYTTQADDGSNVVTPVVDKTGTQLSSAPAKSATTSIVAGKDGMQYLVDQASGQAKPITVQGTGAPLATAKTSDPALAPAMRAGVDPLNGGL